MSPCLFQLLEATGIPSFSPLLLLSQLFLGLPLSLIRTLASRLGPSDNPGSSTDLKNLSSMTSAKSPLLCKEAYSRVSGDSNVGAFGRPSSCLRGCLGDSSSEV